MSMEIQSLDPLMVRWPDGTQAQFQDGRWRLSRGWVSRAELAERTGELATTLKALEDCHHIFIRETNYRVIKAERRGRMRTLGEIQEDKDGVRAYRQWVQKDLARLGMRMAEQSDVPEQLSGVPGLRRFYPGILARVYFLVREGRVVYVGQTTGPWPARIIQHARDPGKDFDDIWYLECDPAEVDGIEQDWIRRLDPEYNRYTPSAPDGRSEEEAP